MIAGSVTPLTVDDEPFIVGSMIERCPKTMMLRELVMNSLEAAQKSEKKLVEISVVEVKGVPKLSIWNTGPGMDASEMLRICNIASSLGKEKSLHANFGMGAKVASLPSNQLGMRYRSCKNGVVHEVILGKRDGKYGRVHRVVETGEYYDVLDVTDAETRSKVLDWTEVVLFGNSEQQDTVRDPYDGDPKQQGQWLANYLYHRFYRIPEGVEVKLLKGTNKLDGNRQFETIPQRARHFEKYDTIAAANGIKVHFIYDAPYETETGSGHNRSISGAIATDVSTCAVIYRNEMYDVKSSRNWTFDAPIFGVPFGAKHISVHIELPNDFPIIPSAYRDYLQYISGEQPRVLAKDFAELVRESRPEWLIALIKSFAPQNASSEDIRDELQKLLNELRVRRTSPRVKLDGRVGVDEGTGPASAPGYGAEIGELGEKARARPSDLTVAPTGSKRADIFQNLERAPKIIELQNEEEIDQKQLKGRAARYYFETGELYVNMLYPAVGDMQSVLEAEYATAPDPEIMRSIASQIARKSMILRIGRTVVYALAKQLNKDWDQKSLSMAWSSESLSMAADDFGNSLQTARRQMATVLRTQRTDASAAV